jgi:hypothetical protein
VISKNTHARREGYFRLEWKLAVDRSHLMASDLPFLLPVVIDDTPDQEDRVPDRFREVQWARLPAGANTEVFVDHVRRLLSPHAATRLAAGVRSSALPASSIGAASTRTKPRATRSFAPRIVGLLILVMGYFVVDKCVPPKRRVPAVEAPATVSAPAFNPPAHSIAVLPFTNMSGDKEQDCFSDGLSEELLNSLARINELQVAARTSSFYFKGEHADLATIAHLTFARRYSDAIRAFRDAKALGQDDASVNMWLGAAYYMSGDLQSARSACEKAEEIKLAKVRAIAGDRCAEGYADIFVQWAILPARSIGSRRRCGTATRISLARR